MLQVAQNKVLKLSKHKTMPLLSATQKSKNVIFMVGDGMGPSFNTAYRYYKISLVLRKMTPTAFDKYLKGTNRTYSNDPKENVTDAENSF